MSSENGLSRPTVARNASYTRVDECKVMDGRVYVRFADALRPHAPLGRSPAPARVPDAYWYRLAIVTLLAVAAITLGVVSDRLRTVEPDAWAADAGWIVMIAASAACMVCFVAWFMAEERA